MTRREKMLLWILAGVAIFGGAVMAVKIARGIRNHNPGNIEKGIRWKGIDTAKTDAESRFIVFIAPEWGIRAMVRLLKNYQRLYGLDTVRKIINRWAPPTENITSAYVAAVARRLNVDPDATINVEAVMPAFIEGIIKHENGSQPYPAATIQRGIELERTA